MTTKASKAKAEEKDVSEIAGEESVKEPVSSADTAHKTTGTGRSEEMEWLMLIPTPVMVIDKDMNVRFMNQAGAAAVSETPESCKGKKCFTLFNTEHCNTENCAVTRAMKKNEVVTSETIARLPGGDLPISYTGAPLKDEKGKIIGGLEYVTDITETKKAMGDAQEKVDYLNNIPTPVMVVDKEMNVLFMNPAGATAVGKTPEACAGKKCFNLFNTGHCNTEKCAVARAMGKDNVFTEETVAKLPGGELPIRYTGAPLKDESGKIVAGLEYVLDITGEIGAVNGILGMVEAATRGELANRADEKQYDGNFLKIIQGINSLLDAIVDPINEASDVLAELAENDLTVKVRGDYKGDLAKIKNAVNTVVESLTVLVTQVKENADGLASASDQLSKASEQAGQATQQIASTSQQVAKGAGEQSTALQQTSQGIEQLSKAIQQISQGAQEQAKSVERNVEIVGQVSGAVSQVSSNAQVASEGSQRAGEAAQKGADMARQTVEGMEKIRETMGGASSTVQDLGERSNEIGKIVATIDDIAAQTNLLALNAAIEAARAGEQGRGFAVVADEVRKLAERSSGATKEIADLIGNIQKGVEEAVRAMEAGNSEVDTGYQLAADAGESLKEILQTVQEVSAEVERITGASGELTTLSDEMVKVTDAVSSVVEENTAATEEMSASADQVTKSIESVAGVAEENSAATEEVSASAEEMSAQVEEVVASAQSLAQMSEELRKNVAVFKLSTQEAETTKSKK